MDMLGPEHLAPIVAYLCTEEAKMINGKIIGAGGGRVAAYSRPFEVAALHRNIKRDGTWTIDELIKAEIAKPRCRN